MTMLEQMARAIQGPLGISTADAMFAAKRTLEAMRVPTEAMIDAGAVAEGDGNLEAEARNLWAAMIDAALAEEPTP